MLVWTRVSRSGERARAVAQVSQLSPSPHLARRSLAGGLGLSCFLRGWRSHQRSAAFPTHEPLCVSPFGGGGFAPLHPLDYPATAPGLVCTTHSAFRLTGTLALTALLATFSHVRPSSPPKATKTPRHSTRRLQDPREEGGGALAHPTLRWACRQPWCLCQRPLPEELLPIKQRRCALPHPSEQGTKGSLKGP